MLILNKVLGIMKGENMKNYLKSNNILEEKIYIGEIPTILLKPKDIEGLLPTIIFYHGWSSDKESQRIRGFLLANLGYQVVMPDAINHGERNPINYQKPENAGKYFWPTVLNNIDESDFLIESLIKDHRADSKAIGITGHSMGGFTAAGIFTQNPNIKTLVVLNGSCYWEDSNKFFRETLGLENWEIDADISEIEKTINKLDPMNNLEKLKNRPILLLNGNADTVVPPISQRMFYNKINPMYDDRRKLKLIRYPDLNHFVTTNMMEDSIIWFHKHLL